jgi:hypothetical protein
MYEKIQYKKNYSINTKHKKIARIDKVVYDKYGNIIESEWFNVNYKKENEYELYNHITDEHGNILRTEIKNKRGKVIQIIVVKYEYENN